MGLLSTVPSPTPFIGAVFSNGVENLTLKFEKNVCLLRFEENKEEKGLEIGLEGNSHLSRIKMNNIPESLVYAAGWFESDDELHIKIRWTETFLVREFVFKFQENKVIIFTPDNQFPPVFPQPEMKAIAMY